MALLSAGKRRAARIAMRAMTTNSSIKVKAGRADELFTEGNEANEEDRIARVNLRNPLALRSLCSHL